jgi:hypothetical protein
MVEVFNLLSLELTKELAEGVELYKRHVEDGSGDDKME